MLPAGPVLKGKYREILEKLAAKNGMLGVIFKTARCEIHNATLLKQVIVNLIDKVDWLRYAVDVKGTIYPLETSTYLLSDAVIQA